MWCLGVPMAARAEGRGVAALGSLALRCERGARCPAHRPSVPPKRVLVRHRRLFHVAARHLVCVIGIVTPERVFPEGRLAAETTAARLLMTGSEQQ